MAIIKRGLSFFLCLALVFSLLPVFAQAEETQAQVDEGDVSIDGSNSVSNLLSQDLQEHLEAQDADGSYNVVGLTVENGVATAELRTLEDAVLVVGIYSEDGMQLLLSATAAVTPEDTQVAVAFEGTMPEYFVASAYLVDVYDHSPLCSNYTTPMYTQEMQELMSSTARDYASDRVLTLADTEETNFLVYEDSTLIIEAGDGVNTVTGIDNENAVYVIENADETVTSLAPGNIFAISYGDNDLLIVKVADITVEGTTATITGAELALEEVFAYAKLEATGNASDATVDETTAEEGVIFEGVTQESAPATRAFEGDTETKFSFNYQFLDKPLAQDSGTPEGSIKLNGKLSLQVDMQYAYYISLTHQFTKFQLDISFGTSLTVEGKAAGKLTLPKITMNVLGLSVNFEPELQLEFSAKMTYTLVAHYMIGYLNDSEAGFKDLSTPADVDSDLKAEGTVFFGIDMRPVANALGGVVETGLSMPVGFELKVTPEGSLIEGYDPEGDTIHACRECTKMELYFKAELSVKMKLLKSDKLSFEFKITPIKFKLCDFYASKDYDRSGIGLCPYKSFRITASVINESADPAASIEVFVKEKDQSDVDSLGLTNLEGIAVCYRPAGTYTFSAQCDGQSYSRTIKFVSSGKVVLSSYSVDDPQLIQADEVTDSGVLASGTFGLGMSWKLDHSGVIRISGKGQMPEWTYSSSTPWYANKSKIKAVIIDEGVTSIGNNAFSGCSKLTRIVMPSSVTQINYSAFSGCTSLTAVTIGSGVLSIGSNAFWGCKKLETVDIPYGVYSILDYAFQNCTSLQSLTVPATVTTIGQYAFQNCTAMKSVSFQAESNSELRIGTRAFQDCTGLTTIIFPHSIKNLAGYAFYRCTGLKEIYFQGNAMSIGSTTFTRVTATVYYPSNNTSWSSTLRKNYGGTLTWVAYEPTVAQTKKPATKAIYGGEYDTQFTEQYTVKTAAFTGLVPAEEYLLLAVVSMEAEDLLSAENLLCVSQAQAAQDGTLTFTYAQRVDTAISYVMACGASNKNLEDAEISFPAMSPTDQAKAVEVTVFYDGEELLEGRDYILLGTADCSRAGTYTCYIRGIYRYCGLVECSYTVEYPILAEAEDGFYIKLDGDYMIMPELTHDLYIDLNGYDLTGTVNTNGYNVYGMDSTTDEYTCDAIGYFDCVDENGVAVVPVTHHNSDITGTAKRYMAIKDENGYSFHRFYLGLTHMSLKPAASGVGYKAVFYGDEAVAANLNSFGYTMTLEDRAAVTVTKNASDFVSGKTISLRIENYDVENFGEATLSASVMLKLNDGTVIEGPQHTMTLRSMLEKLNEKHTALSAEQLTAVAEFIKKHECAGSWSIGNLVSE